MKVGILTFHAQRNYGGVLQAWALQTAIENLGYDVIVIDRILTHSNRHLHGPDLTWTLPELLKYTIRNLLGIANTGLYRRVVKTKDFLRKYLHLTSYSFYKWEDAPQDLGIDAFVVGSDQVWHKDKNWGNPTPYFLAGAPHEIPAISYAASFGMKTIPDNYKTLYSNGLKRFRSISVREDEGVRLVRSCGGDAVHVVDPTLLVPPGIWIKTFGMQLHKSSNGKKNIVFYLFETITAAEIMELVALASAVGWQLIFLTDLNVIRIPRDWESLRETALIHDVSQKILYFDYDADPGDLVNRLYCADAVVTDSFHGVALSTILGRNLRILRPCTAQRKVMFSRLEEFADSATGEIFSPNVRDAVKSILDGIDVRIPIASHQKQINDSKSWLAMQLKEI